MSFKRNRIFIFNFDLHVNYFYLRLKTSTRQDVSQLLETSHKVFDSKQTQFLERRYKRQ